MLMSSCRLLFIAAFIVLSQVAYGQEYEGGNAGQISSQSMLHNIEGVWISDLYSTEDYSGLPYYVLIVQNGEARLDMIGYGYAETLASNSPSDMPKEERLVAQKKVVKGSSIYLAWANERLKVPNQTVAFELGQTGGDVVHAITKQGTSELFGDSFMGELGSDFVSGVVSSVISGLIMDAFTPSKKINVLEMNILQNNEFELTAHAYIQEIKIKGEEKPLVTNIEKNIRFTKYDPASGVFFDIPYKQKIYVPGEGFLSEIPKRYQEIGKSYIRYYDLRVPTHISQETMLSYYQTLPSDKFNANPFNIFQIMKLQYYNEQRLLILGYEHTISKPYLGAVFEIKEDNKGNKGCYVRQISHLSPAYLFDIQEGDLLLNIDGYDIDTPEQARLLIESLNPYEWVTFRLKRGKKTISVDVELSKH